MLTSFKALSRMSSFPTYTIAHDGTPVKEFQSAVAHELISNDFDGDCLAILVDHVSKRCRA